MQYLVAADATLACAVASNSAAASACCTVTSAALRVREDLSLRHVHAEGQNNNGACSRGFTSELLQVRQYAPDVLVLAPGSPSLPRALAAAGDLASLSGWWALPAVKASQVSCFMYWSQAVRNI